MSWAVGYDQKWQRDIGYGVPATCDYPGCGAAIDRGLPYVCGSQPYGGEYGCGLYFCPQHQHVAGDKRDNVHLCARCYHGKYYNAYTPTPDVQQWIDHKATHPSWAQWRKEQGQRHGS